MKSGEHPKKHHYIPAFYLKRWAVDGKVTEFRRWPRDIVPKRVSAEATGFKKCLYELKGHEAEFAQQVEEKFFKPVDTQAHRALEMLENHGHYANWCSRTRSSWSQFILSLLLRTPEDIGLLREWWQEEFGRTDNEIEERYRAVRLESSPETFSEFLEGQPLGVKERYQFEILFSLIANENVGAAINNMHWRVLQTPLNAPTLLTSDRPVLRTSNIKGPRGHVALPIGPRLLFIASLDAQFLEQVLEADQVGVVKEVNRQVVEGAVHYVYGADESQYRSIKDRFGKTPQPRFMEELLAKRKAET